MLAAVAVMVETSNPAQTAHAQNYGNVVCSTARGDRCPGYGDVGGGVTIFWSTTMTVGTDDSTQGLVRTENAGYGASGPSIGSLPTTQVTYSGTDRTISTVVVTKTTVSGTLESDVLNFSLSSTFSTTADDKLALELDGTRFLLKEANKLNNAYVWSNHGLNWANNDSVAVKLIELPTPNAYGYRTIWTALMTAGTINTKVGYTSISGSMSNNLIVKGRDETITIGTEDQPRFPWTGYRITEFLDEGTTLEIDFSPDSYPSIEEVANWRLDLGGGIVLPFPSEPVHIGTPWIWQFDHDPGWTDGDQVLVSIRNDEVQNRVGQVRFKSRRSTIRTDQTTEKIVYGKTHFSYDHEPNGGKFGRGDSWELRSLGVTTDKTGDTDPVWITATFRAHNVGDARRAYQGYWEGEFEDFHTLLLSWAYSVDGSFIGGTTYTLPLRSAAGIGYRAKYDGRPDNYQVSGGHDVTFTWVRTYKEFKDKHLDLANHGGFSATMLGAPQPATARLTVVDDGDNLQRQYVPTTVTGVEFTSDPGADYQVYGPWDAIEVTVTFSDDVTVGYKRSKKYAAEIDLELGDQTRTAHYDRTEGKKVIFKYTVVPGDNAPVALRIPVNSLRLYRDEPSEHGSIRDSDGRDVHLDHAGLASQAHPVDAVAPQFAGAEVSADGSRVAVAFDEDMQSPTRLRALGVQTSLLQKPGAGRPRGRGSWPLAATPTLSGDTITLAMEEPITEGQSVTVSYDNLVCRQSRITSSS